MSHHQDTTNTRVDPSDHNLHQHPQSQPRKRTLRPTEPDYKRAGFETKMDVGASFRDSQPLADAEAHHLLQRTLQTRVEHVNARFPPGHPSHTTLPELERKLLDDPGWSRYFALKGQGRLDSLEEAGEKERECYRAGLGKLEGAYLTGLGCASAEEARMLVPGLEGLGEGELEGLVEKLAEGREREREEFGGKGEK